jgi:hypothetical protein
MNASMRVHVVHGAALVVCLAASAGQATAQSGGWTAIGPNVTFHLPVSGDLQNVTSFGVAYRFSKPSQRGGWGPDFGFGWFSADLSEPLGGHLTVRPVMGGVNYRWIHGKIRTHVGVITGPAFTKFEADDSDLDRYSAALGYRVIGVDAERFRWATRPGARVSYDFNRRWGAYIGADYEHARAKLLIRREGGSTVERSVKADLINVKIGFLFSPF